MQNSDLLILRLTILLGCFLSVLAVKNVYKVRDDDNQICLYASFDVTFYIYVSNNKTMQNMVQTRSIMLPRSGESNMTVGGACNKDNHHYALQVDWVDKTNFSLVIEFSKYTEGKSSNWTLRKISFDFTLEYFDEQLRNEEFDCTRSYETDEGNLFNRMFRSNEYYYCDSCNKYLFSNASGACFGEQCSFMTLDNSRIYLGDYDSDKPKKKLCLKDWIAEREIIVPIAVGGFLTFLVVVLILVYIGTFVRRKMTEKSNNYRRLMK